MISIFDNNNYRLLYEIDEHWRTSRYLDVNATVCVHYSVARSLSLQARKQLFFVEFSSLDIRVTYISFSYNIAIIFT